MSNQIICIDASVFLGMHSDDDIVRVKCKNFFIANSDKTLLMSLEQVGIVDDVIWNYSHKIQASYYPFLDYVQTEWSFKRLRYEAADFYSSKKIESKVLLSDKLLMAMAKRYNAPLASLKKHMQKGSTELLKDSKQQENCFKNKNLEKMYIDSLVVKIKKSDLEL